MLSNVCLNPSQSALVKFLRVGMGIWRGLVEMRVMVGKWSLVVMSPCDMCVLWYAWLLARTMSGVVAVSCL